MPYVYRPYPQAIDEVDKGVQDVYHSNNCFINQVQVALWQPPGSSDQTGGVSYPPDEPVLDYAPNPEQRRRSYNAYYASLVNPTTFYATRGGTRGRATLAGNFDMPGTGTSDANDLSGTGPSNPDGSYQRQQAAKAAAGTTTTSQVNDANTPLKPKEMYNYLIGLGVKDPQAKALVVNARRESGLNPCMTVNDRGAPGGGLFSWRAERLTAMQQACPDWCTNWQCQIQYALYGEARRLSAYDVGAWLARDMTPEEASKQWVYGWERPQYPAKDQQTNMQFMRQFFG